uniref:Uncharacterized protein n=1 Tax=Arundo donax TaxID=35708 RepID=A0A0A9ERG3_ARUDO
MLAPRQLLVQFSLGSIFQD